MKNKIYVASSWRNKYIDNVYKALDEAEIGYYNFKNPIKDNNGFSWKQIDPDWQNWSLDAYKEALKHPLAETGFALDFTGCSLCKACILVLPSGRSAHVEAGFMAGSGKRVWVLQPKEEKVEPDLMYKMFDGVFESIYEIILRIQCMG